MYSLIVKYPDIKIARTFLLYSWFTGPQNEADEACPIGFKADSKGNEMAPTISRLASIHCKGETPPRPNTKERGLQWKILLMFGIFPVIREDLLLFLSF